MHVYPLKSRTMKGPLQPSLTARHSPPPAEGSLHGAVLRQWLPSKTKCLDAVASGVTPLVALVAGQIQVAGSGPSQGEGSLLLCFQQLPGHLHSLYLVFRVPGHSRGDKGHVLSPDPVLQSCVGWVRVEGWSCSCPGPSGVLPYLASEGGQRASQDRVWPLLPFCLPKISPMHRFEKFFLTYVISSNYSRCLVTGPPPTFTL